MGTGSFWKAAQPAALKAPCAVEWLTEASPKEQRTIASEATCDPMPMRFDRSMATDIPTALGRCDAMVLVCGCGEGKQQLVHGVYLGALPSPLQEERSAAVVEQRRIAGSRKSAQNRV